MTNGHSFWYQPKLAFRPLEEIPSALFVPWSTGIKLLWRPVAPLSLVVAEPEGEEGAGAAEERGGAELDGAPPALELEFMPEAVPEALLQLELAPEPAPEPLLQLEFVPEPAPEPGRGPEPSRQRQRKRVEQRDQIDEPERPSRVQRKRIDRRADRRAGGLVDGRAGGQEGDRPAKRTLAASGESAGCVTASTGTVAHPAQRERRVVAVPPREAAVGSGGKRGTPKRAISVAGLSDLQTISLRVCGVPVDGGPSGVEPGVCSSRASSAVYRKRARLPGNSTGATVLPSGKARRTGSAAASMAPPRKKTTCQTPSAERVRGAGRAREANRQVDEVRGGAPSRRQHAVERDVGQRAEMRPHALGTRAGAAAVAIVSACAADSVSQSPTAQPPAPRCTTCQATLHVIQTPATSSGETAMGKRRSGPVLCEACMEAVEARKARVAELKEYCPVCLITWRDVYDGACLAVETIKCAAFVRPTPACWACHPTPACPPVRSPPALPRRAVLTARRARGLDVQVRSLRHVGSSTLRRHHVRDPRRVGRAAVPVSDMPRGSSRRRACRAALTLPSELHHLMSQLSTDREADRHLVLPNAAATHAG